MTERKIQKEFARDLRGHNCYMRFVLGQDGEDVRQYDGNSGNIPMTLTECYLGILQDVIKQMQKPQIL